MSMWEETLELVALEIVYTFDNISLLFALFYYLSGFLKESLKDKDSVLNGIDYEVTILEMMPLWIVKLD